MNRKFCLQRNEIGGGWGDLSVFIFIALFVAVVFTGAVYWAGGVAAHCKPEPTTITASELANNGPPKDNWFVHVTDYRFDNVRIYKGTGAGPFLKYVKCDVLPNGSTVSGSNTLSVKNQLGEAGKMTPEREEAAKRFAEQTTFNAIAIPDASRRQINLQVCVRPGTTGEKDEMLTLGFMWTGGLLSAFVFCLVMESKSKSRRRR